MTRDANDETGPRSDGAKLVTVPRVYGAIAILVLSFALVLCHWRYQIFFHSVQESGGVDGGYRYDFGVGRCQKPDGTPGRSKNLFGPCGDLKEVRRSFVVEKNLVAIGAMFKSTVFEIFHFEWISGEESRWQEGEFRNGRMHFVNYNRAQFENVKFEGIDFLGASLNGAKFVNCHFRDVNFKYVSFFGAEFIDSIISDSECEGCDFRGAKFVNSKILGKFKRAVYSEKTLLPFPITEAASHGFEYLDHNLR